MGENTAATTFYSLEEVSKHDGKDDSRTWIIIKDSVYDVTDYLDDHPGGAELITEWAGKDGTKEFDDFGHSGDAKKQLKTYKIGEVVEEQRKKKNKKTEKNTKENEQIKNKGPTSSDNTSTGTVSTS
ncbi:hypothetical protein JTB14_007193 [Gonioctena quinquepunctata]|nr:hypothetical protein JTB14_007193 [Gonioctena quinquepunctata]